MKNLLVGTLLSFCLCSCKSAEFRSSNSSSATAISSSLNTPSLIAPVTFTLRLESSNEHETYQIQENKNYTLQSPLAWVSIAQYDDFSNEDAAIVDFFPNGRLINTNDETEIPTSCIDIDIYSIFSSAYQNHLFLVWNKKGQKLPTPADKLGNFQYCQTDGSVELKIPTEEVGAYIYAYFSQRGLDFSQNTFGFFGELWGRFKQRVRNAGNTIRNLGRRNLGRRDQNRTTHSLEEREVEIDGLPYSSESSSTSRNSFTERKSSLRSSSASVKARQLEHLESLPVLESVKSNRLHYETYLEIQPHFRETKELDSGAFATVYRVVFDGKEYALRVEKRPEGMSANEFQLKRARDRFHFLIQNEFAKIHPEAGFVRTHLSFFTDDHFVTMMEFRGGGAVIDRLGKASKADKKRWADQIRNQLEIYQNGGPEIFHRGVKWKVHFYHGDIKPDNMILDSSLQQAGFIDFGFSRVLLSAENNLTGEMNFCELTIKADGSYDSGFLTIDSKVGSEFNVAKGTYLYISPELIHMRNHSPLTFKDDKAALILFNSDRYSYLVFLSILIEDRFPAYIGKKITDRQAVLSNVAANVPAKFDSERKALSFDQMSIDPMIILTAWNF